jgi:hypothetical protein
MTPVGCDPLVFVAAGVVLALVACVVWREAFGRRPGRRRREDE